MTADPVSRTTHEELVNDVRALKARLGLGLPVVGIVLGQLVPTVADRDEPATTLSASITSGDHPSATLLVIILATALVLVLGLAAAQLSRPVRISAVALAAAYGVATIVLWGLLGGTSEAEVHAVAGYLALPASAAWALIGAVTAGAHSD